MQFNSGIAAAANIRPGRYLPTDLCTIGSGGWRCDAGRSCRRMLLVPSLWLQRRWVRSEPPRWGIELYEGLVHPFQRWGKGYELRCGQLYERTIAAFADRR
jgi:hypothetical protein